MKTELLTRIKDAESEARQTTAKAEEQAKKIVADARREAEGIAQDAKEQSEHQYQTSLDAARDEAASETAATLAAGQKEADALVARFESGHAAATERVLALFEESL